TTTSTSVSTGGNFTTMAFTAGVFASQAITLETAGANQTITATNSGSSEFGTSNTFTVDPAVADHLFILTQPAGVVKDTPFGAVIQVRDAFENVVTTDNSSTITATVNTGTGALTGTVLVTVSGGVATFSNLLY